jgi:AAA+ ATPase superfamily predicted ATPase
MLFSVCQQHTIWYAVSVLMLKPTPFHYEEPLPAGEDLVDREEELSGLSERAVAGRNTRLVAPRRYGKTSLLKHLIAIKGRAGSGFEIGVYVDLYGAIGAADVAVRLERALRTTKLPRGQGRWLDGRLRTLARSAQVRMGPLSVTRSDEAGPPRSGNPGALEDRFAIFAELQDRVRAPVIVVLDEFQAVLADASEIDARIRSEIQHHARVGYIFAGSHVGMMRELFANRTRPFYAQAAPLTLGPLPPGPLAEYIGARFERHHRDCERVLGALLDLGQGHPQRSMMLAAHLFAVTPRGSPATEATLEDALNNAMREADNELQGRWDAFTVSQRRALAALADRQAPFSQAAARAYGTSKGATGKALAGLAASADIASATDGSWVIVDPFLREWVQRLRTRG